MVGQRVEARVIAERAFENQLLGRVDVSFDDELGRRRHLDLRLCGARDQIDAAALEKAGEKRLVDARRQGAGRRVGQHRRPAEGDGDGHALAALLVEAEVAGAVVVHVPMHGGQPRLEELHAIHADVAVAGVGVLCEHRAERDVPAAVVGPAFERRQQKQVGVVGVDDLLADAALHDLRRQAAELGQFGQLFQLLHERGGNLGLENRRHTLGDRVEAVGAERPDTSARACRTC